MKRIFVIIIFLFLSVAVSLGCECYSEPHGKVFRKTTAIFVGKLISIGDERIQKEGYSPLRTLTFEIEKSWKGMNGNRIIIFTNYSNMCSAFEFQSGSKYLLYAYKLKSYNNFYVTSECASSKELLSDSAQERVKDLDSFWFRLKSRIWIF